MTLSRPPTLLLGGCFAALLETATYLTVTLPWTPPPFAKDWLRLCPGALVPFQITRLYRLPAPLLADCSFGRDFHRVVRGDAGTCEDCSFVHAQDGRVFEPTVVGGVVRVHDGGHGFVTVELGIPPHATSDLDALFWNQVACLEDVLSALSRPRAGCCIGEFVRWSNGPFLSAFNADSHRIFIEIPVSTTLRLQCRDYPHPSRRHTNEIVRVSPYSNSTACSLSATPTRNLCCPEGSFAQLKKIHQSPGSLFPLRVLLHRPPAMDFPLLAAHNHVPEDPKAVGVAHDDSSGPFLRATTKSPHRAPPPANLAIRQHPLEFHSALHDKGRGVPDRGMLDDDPDFPLPELLAYVAEESRPVGASTLRRLVLYALLTPIQIPLAADQAAAPAPPSKTSTSASAKIHYTLLNQIIALERLIADESRDVMVRSLPSLMGKVSI
ncbi:hypothetical protein C8R47DRAFT_1075545 [Mycena vitilis]|nr:hypothetical protein C8R47DRAFT_1075545 [Mycena vitilis]